MFVSSPGEEAPSCIRSEPSYSKASCRFATIILTTGRIDCAESIRARTPSLCEPSCVSRCISVAVRIPSAVGTPCCASDAALTRCFRSDIADMSFQCPLVTSGTSAMNMPSPGFVPGKVLTTPQGFRSIKSGTLTDVGSTKIRLLSAACTLSILERSNQVDISCIGSSKSYKDWLYVLCWSLYRPPKATGNCLPYGLS